MTLSTKNFAQIKTAENIEIKDLNIFIGKNGSGKTYFAKLIYFLNSIQYKAHIFKKSFSKKIKNSFDNKIDILFTTKEQDNFKKLFITLIQNEYHNLIDSDKEFFKDFKFDFEIQFKDFQLPFQEDIGNYKDYELYVMESYIDKSFNLTISHYLPAARANYMVTYKYLFLIQYDILRNQKNISLLPEIENNFLEDIYKVNTKYHGYLYSLGSKIEKNIFKTGKISIRNPKHQDLPTYKYRLKGFTQTLDLTTTSSAITELSPLIMYFRHKIANPNKELLIIDEPELSLHPEAQAKLVEIIVEAVNKGLKIILVTHSPYILEALNNHLQRYKIRDCELSKDIKEFEEINPNQVSAYLFEDENIKNILDDEVKLIDDKLLHSFNNLNNIYDKMRDVEWDNLDG